MLTIRLATTDDFEQIWPILHEVMQQGDTYSFSPKLTKKEAYSIWMETPLATYVALQDNQVVGTYFMKPNQPALGAHVCNAGYVVSLQIRGKGIGKAMCLHSLQEAVSRGFKAMQFNFVVSTNLGAVALWRKCGFTIVGTIPNAFNHQKKGLVDVFVMYQWLQQES